MRPQDTAMAAGDKTAAPADDSALGPQSTRGRAKPVRHVDCLKIQAVICIPIDVMDQDSLRAANAVVDKMKADLRTAGAYVDVAAGLGRVKGTLLP